MSWLASISQGVGSLVQQVASVAEQAALELKAEEQKAQQGALFVSCRALFAEGHQACPVLTFPPRPPRAGAEEAAESADGLQLPWEDLGANCPEDLKARVKKQVPRVPLPPIAPRRRATADWGSRLPSPMMKSCTVRYTLCSHRAP